MTRISVLESLNTVDQIDNDVNFIHCLLGCQSLGMLLFNNANV